MIVNLKDDDISSLVEGISGCGRGLVSAALSKTANAPDDGPHYDHKRHHAQKHGAASWPQSDHHQWDFVFTRDDGTSFWLHPNFSDNKVESGECSSSGHRVQPPPSGRGGSGPGQVYKAFKNARKEKDLKFDKGKNDLQGKTRANGKRRQCC